MITKIKRNLLLVVGVLTIIAPVAVPLSVSADCGTNIGGSVKDGLNATSNTPGKFDCDKDSSTEGIGKIAKNVVNIFSFVVGAISVIMIIYGGFRYITSGGSSEGVGAAKSTLIYAIVGLVIVALAQLIVQFVLSQSTGLTE